MTSFAHTALVVLQLLCGLAASNSGTCHSTQGECAQASAIHDDGTSLIQIALSPARRGSKNDHAALEAVPQAEDKQTCSVLNNQGAYFTVEVNIGTPEQKFKLVADTGSIALIIPDCRCVKAGYCEALNTTNCFDSNVSSSFGLDIIPTSVASQKVGADGKESVTLVGAKMNYGSGAIQVLASTDAVRVEGVKTNMRNGVFLMEDRRSLKVHGDFEGILGLGLPHQDPKTNTSIDIPAFMQESKSRKYNLCFNEYPNAGALRMGMNSLPNAMTNIGTVHWAVGLDGFSVGDSKTPTIFCGKDTLKKGQKTPCGAIPDSGTTLMMGPKDQIRTLYAKLCDQWPRCKTAAAKNKTKGDTAFHDLLFSCEDWMTDDKGVNEIPSIFLHMSGEEGKVQTVELSAWSFIVETTQEIYKIVTGKIFGKIPIQGAVDTGQKKKICTASFGAQKYDTAQNGPVWILGAPMFYSKTVAYDLGDKDTKPQIAFVDGSCKTCDGNAPAAALLDSGSEAGHHSAHKTRRLRHMSTYREPSIDLTHGL